MAVSRWRARLLWLLLALFSLRVLGQLLVALDLRGPLPDMAEWQSGVLPYPVLLLSQIAILAVFAKICRDFTRAQGFFAEPKVALGAPILGLGLTYFGVMALRYVMRMALYPPERWVGGSIPIFLHWVLATFVIVVGLYHWRATHQTRGQILWWHRALGAATGLLVGVAVLFFVTYTLAPSATAAVIGARAPEYAVRNERMTMRTSDGVELAADVFHPVRTGRTPTILVRAPLPSTSQAIIFTNVVGRLWAERGYTAVIQHSRPLLRFGGSHEPFVLERQDGIETLAWIAQQPWFDGRIGTWGGSYFGYTQWVLADQVSPGPSAFLIQIASSNWHDMFYPNGAFSLESALFMAVGSDGDRDLRVSREEYLAAYPGFPVSAADDWAVGNVGFFDDWATHPERDAYWTAFDGEGRSARLVAPALLMAGWYDPFLPTQLADFQHIRAEGRPDVAAESRLIIGPWTHAETVAFPDGVEPSNYRLESIAPSVAWFDQHLHGGPRFMEAPIRIYVMGAHRWRDEWEWPPARAQSMSLYLRGEGRANGASGDGRLSLDLPTVAEPPDRFRYDPSNPVPTRGGAMLGSRAGIYRQNEVESRGDVLIYSTAPLEQPVEVTGPVKAVLFVETDRLNTDFTAKLVDVHPDGSAFNISDGILRRAYGSAVDGASSVQQIEIDLWPTSMLFLAGHRIRLEVSSSNYPRYDRNPNTGRPVPRETESVVAQQTVHHGKDAASRLVLSVIPRDSL